MSQRLHSADVLVPSAIAKGGGEGDQVYRFPLIEQVAAGFINLLMGIEKKIAGFEADFTNLVECAVVHEHGAQDRTFGLEILRKFFQTITPLL